MSQRIAWAEPQGLNNVSFGFFGATDEYLAEPDVGMCRGKISIERQCMFTFDDALHSAIGRHADHSQVHVAKRMVRD